MGDLYPAPVQRTGRAQFGMVDAAIIRDPSLPTNVKLVYTYLATFCGTEREAFPSRARIARELGLSVRTVDTANRIAKDAGLFVIARRGVAADAPPGAEFHAPNIYLLRDFDGGYQAGSGPLAQPLRQGDAQPLQEGGATAAHYQDHSPEPPTDQTITPPGEDDCASVGHEQVRDLWLKRPDDLEQLDPGHVAERLTGVFAKALKARGVIATQDARDKIGESVKAAFAEGMSHDQVWRAFCSLLDNAWHGRNEHGWLVASAGVGTRQWAA